MLPVPMFPRWRPIWDAPLGEAVARLDALVTERHGRRSSTPVVTAEMILGVTSERVQSFVHGSLVLPPDEAFALLQDLRPLLEAAVWPRWLLLEEALGEAATSGSLHVAALVLRTQIEELDALLDVERLLALTPQSIEADDGQLLANSVAVLAKRVLPRIHVKSADELQQPAGEAPGVAYRTERLQRVFDELGDYVHPNYGNHILLVRPHSIEAASLIIDSFVAVYETFLSLPWVRPAEPAPESPTRYGEQSFKVLADLTVPKFSNACGARIEATRWSDAVSIFHHQVRVEEMLSADAGTVETEGIPELNIDLNVEAAKALRASGAPPALWPTPISTAAERLRYVHLVDDERKLVAAVERLAAVPGKRDDATAWLQMMCSGLTFAININEFRLDILGRQAALLLNAENLLGATLVVRSMLEHHAVAIELSKKVIALWEQIERTATNDQRLTSIFGEAEKQIARVLVSAPESREQIAPWRALWEGTVRRYHVLDPVSAVDKDQPGYLKTYGLLSHIVHGTVCTGGDLLEESVGGGMTQQLAQLALSLATMCDPESMLDRQAGAIVVAQRLAMTARDPAPNLSSRVVNMRLIEGQKLKPGRDVRGSGTEDDPFHFRRGLLYHDAYGHWLKQHGVQVADRRLHKFAQGIGDRVETEDGRVLFFLNDTLAALLTDKRDEAAK